MHGDSHYFRIDKPFLDSQGRRLENFTRVKTFGDHQENGNNDVHWLKVLVDTRSNAVFTFIVRAIRTIGLRSISIEPSWISRASFRIAPSI